MSYIVEKGVVLPPPKTNYPWLQMEIEDSFFVPLEEKKGSVVRSAASWANNKYAPKRWVVKQVLGGHRVWRQA